MDNQDKLLDYLKKTAAELQETRKRLHKIEAGAHEPLAIVGMACRLPGADTPEEYWDLLAAGGDGISEFPLDRGWDLESLYDPDPAGNGSITRSGGFIRDASGFDNEFFKISPREAMAMDPQQRVLLEVSWEALERAGIDAESLRASRTGVFVGGFTSNYAVNLAMSDEGLEEYSGHLMTGNLTSVISGRVAYALGLEGTALTVDTACSSSLVALHLACQAVRSGECTTALAGGITVLVNPGNFVEFSRQQGLAADGRCRAFSADASGTGWAEGAGMVVVERLSDARRLGHHVLAVIRGSAVNQDGASNGLTAPNGPSQQRVIRAALANAQLSAAEVDVVEAHGTATTLGDPIEAQALLATYGKERPGDQPLWLGSAKSNIGHTQAAAGVAGVMKMVLALQNGVLPKTLYVSEPTPFVDWTAGQVQLLTEPVPWPAGERVRRAGVSAFGGSGTNAHLILEEAPAAEENPETGTAAPVVSGAAAWLLSGRSADGLSAQAERLRDWVTDGSDADAAAVAWSLATTRVPLEHRAVVVGADRAELEAGLGELAAGGASATVVQGVVRDEARPVFVFPGQGSQWIGMGRELIRTSPVFAARINECERALAPYVPWNLSELLDADDIAPDADVVQPLLWAVMVALAAVWEAAGVTPHAVAGHSQGEIAAATVAGMLSLEDAAKVVALRSRTLRTIAGAGGMMSVAEPVAAVEQRLGWWGDRISVAAVNGPSAVVLSGEPEALEELKERLTAEGVRARIVAVDYASHCAQIAPLESGILAALDGITPRAGRVPMVSSTSGAMLTGTELDAAYWYASLREPVQFERSVRTLAAQGHQVFIEVSPHPVLLGAMNDTLEEVAADAGPGIAPAAVCRTLRRDDGGTTRLVTSFAEAWVHGVPVDWTAVLPAAPWVDLPTYAFRRTPYWPNGTLSMDRLGAGGGDPVSLGLGSVGHPFLGATVELAGGAGLVCTGRLSLRTQPWLADHAVSGIVLLPSTGFVELAVRAGDQAGCAVLEELTLQAPLVLPADGGAVQVQVVVAGPDPARRRTVEIYGRAGEGEWTRHASGTLAPATEAARTDDDLLTWPPRDATPIDIADVYAVHLADVYGPAFRGLRAAWRRGGDIFAEVALPDEQARQAGSFDLHPALLDAALHGTVLEAVDAATAGEPGPLLMPFAWNDVELHATGASALRVRLRRDDRGGLSLTAADPSGAVVVSVGSLVHRPVSVDQLQSAGGASADTLFVPDWVPVAGTAAGGREWVLIGPDRLELTEGLAATGVPVRRFTGLGDLAAAAEAGEVDPGLVLTCVGGAGDDVPDAARRLAGDTLELIQEWLDQPHLALTTLVPVTRGAVDAVPGDTVTDLAAAAARGLLRSAQAEYPGRLVLADLSAAGDVEVLPSVVDSGEPELAIRERIAYGRRLIRPSGTPDPAERPSRTGRSLLVTGGTGTLGALVARHFVATGRAAGAVLTSRSGPAAPRVATLAAEVAELGGWVRIVACDAADRDAIATVLGAIPAANPLGSVIHSAGVVDDGVIALITPERLAAVMRPKVDAAWHLHELTADLDLDRFVTFSSAAATFGAAGQGSYVTANSFLDALASYRRSAGRPSMSLQLGPWMHDVGIGRNLDERALARIDQSFTPLGADDGLAVMDVALGRPEAVLMPAKLDPVRLRQQAARGTEIPPIWRVLAGSPATRRTAVSATGTPGGPGEALRRQLAAVSGPDRDRLLLDLVCAQVAAVLGYGTGASIEAGRAFTDIGFDSLTAVDMRNRLTAETGLRLPATLVFDYPSPVALAAMLREELTGDLPATGAPMAPVPAATDEPVAIVGMACRFPGGAVGPDELWQLLDAGSDVVGPLPLDRGWDIASLYDPDGERSGTMYTQAGGFVRDASGFDAGFFGISPREALAMDPQQRLLLETSWEALERAGIDPATLRGSQTGAFIGGSASGYGLDVALEDSGVAEAHLLTGTAASVLSGRVSYALGLEGPAVTVDTACSSALVALHMASQAIRAGECSLALVGGVAVAVSPAVFVAFSQAKGVSVDGRCKSFAADADGSGFSEGAGMLVVERLSDARRNGHRVLAVVRGSAINQDGASNGLTAPNGPSQQRVIRAALANAGVTPEDIDVVEAHGSATTLGDPIEAQALIATYGKQRAADRPLWLGSVKSNIGHTQTAAGSAGLIKMVLALQNQQMPRTLHADEPTPHVDWSAGHVRLLHEAVPWPTGDRVRRGGVSAFGMSGTNVHVILEEAPADEPAPPNDQVAPIVDGGAWLVSARTADGLTAQAARLHDWVNSRPGLDPAAVAWSLAATRSSFEHRAVVVGQDRAELTAGLLSLADRASVRSVVSGVTRSNGRTAFVFAGQGSQWLGMGRELRQSSPVFAARLAECEAALSPYVDWSPAEVLAGAGGAPELESADVVQPVLWAVMVSLAAVWEAAGIRPDAVLGHSQGEIAAATVAGILSLADGARVVAARSRALSGLSMQGSMVSVVMPSEPVRELTERWGDRLSLAAVNSPAASVVSGEPEALAEFERELASRHVMRWRIPATDFVAHSPAVEPLSDVLRAELATITPQTGRVPMVSTVTGDWVTGPDLDAGYWYSNLRNMVRFEEAVRLLLGGGYGAFVEVSPHPVLTAAVTETAEDAGTAEVLVVGTLERDNGGATRLLTALAQAYVGGLAIDWTTVLPAARRVDLPTYAFQHQRYWLESSAAPKAVTGGAGTAAEQQFWAAVEGGDLARLADTLAIRNLAQLSDVVPALASWRRREQDRSVTADWRYRVVWAPVPEPGPARLSGQWLVVTPAGVAADLLEGCVTALAARGAEPVVVEVPAGTVHRADLTALLNETLWDGGAIVVLPTGVLSLLALDETPTDGRPTVPGGLSATLALTQGLGDAGVGAPLWVLTSGAVAAGPDELLTNPLQAQAWGFGRVVGLEYPERWGGLIDVPAVLDERAGARLVAVLAGCDENQVVIRSAGIMSRRMNRAPQPTVTRNWRPEHGSTLITGGNGALAGHVARWLADGGADRMVLTSRSGPGAWDAAAHAADLATRGSRVDVLTCDVSNRSDLAELIDWTGRSGPPLSAVVHTAGVLDDGVIDRLSPERLETVLSAKAASATHLDELTADLDLDAFVLFSSVVATTGGPGQANYAAANAYLDAVAENRRGRGLPAVAVAWGPWSGGGVAQGSEAARQRLARNEWEALMDPDLAVRALGEAVDGTDAMLTVTNINWSLILADPHAATDLLKVPVMRDLPEVRRAAEALTNLTVAAPEEELVRRLAGETRADQRRILIDLVRAGAARVLGFGSPEEIESGRPFSDFGFDSLTSVELRNQLATATNLRLPATLLFDYPTPTALAEYLQAELLGAGTDDGPAPVAPAAPVAGEQIAIVGMSCRYPGGVSDPEAMWALLTADGDAISGFPDDRGWDLAALSSGEGYASYVQSGGFLSGMSEFDAGFFGISPREALAMDPQQRLLLEVSWEAIERAGIDPHSLRGSATGVFAGGYASGYGLGGDFEGAAQLITGNATSVLSGRVSYTLGLEGPAVTVDTACSSSLVALHLAAQALRTGECSMALAGGITVLVTPDGFVGFSEQSGLARDGRCKAFSAQADGMGFAEGVGMVVVERLSDARRNGHPVLAVLRGSAVNQDGASNGLTAPNGPSQQRVIRAALANAGLRADEVDVVEAHGTGTKLGDPIEAQALLATYGRQRPADRPLLLGSVKSNIGHTQAAAGVAGIIKMVLAMQHQHLPKTLHADEPSPHVDWSAGDVRLLTEPAAWPADGHPRRAGVSSFGLSGTNAHVILEEPAAAPSEAPEPVEPVFATGTACAWLVSARSAEGLAGQAARLRDWATARPELDPADVAWSLATTRSSFEYRAVVVDSGRGALVSGLDSLAAGLPVGSLVSGAARPDARVVFAFAGQGSQWVGMGRDLLDASPVFAARLAECERALSPYVSWSLTEVLSGEDQDWNDADVVQPLLWAVMVSLAAVWEAAGVRPDAVVGHSQGEIAAATVAGMLSVEDAAKVVALRSQTLRAIRGAGGMLSVARSAAELQPRLNDRISIAAVNGPAAVVLSGEPEALAELKLELEAEGVRARMVAVDYASHCAQIDPLEPEILAVLDGLNPRAGRVPMVSAMTGETLSGTELTAAYWYASLRAPVQFERAVRTLAGQGYQVFVEVTPHPVLLGAMTDTLEDAALAAGPGAVPAAVCGTLRRDEGGPGRLLTSLAEAWVHGAPVNWTGLLPSGTRVDLPTYAFQHVRYWPRPAAAARNGDAASLGLGAVDHPLLGAAVELAGGAGVVCTGRLSVRTHPWLADHQVGGVVLLPGTGFVEMVVRAGDQVGCGRLEELTLQAPLVVPADGGGVQIQVVVAAADAEGRRGFEVFARPDEPGTRQAWVQHASGQVAPVDEPGAATDDLAVWPPRDAMAVDISGLYDSLGDSYKYGPAFRTLQAVWRRGAEVFAEVALPDGVARDAGAFGLHPALLDGVLHASFLATDADAAGHGQVRLPFSWTGVRLYACGASVLRARLGRDGLGNLVLAAVDAAGAPVVSVDSLVTRPVAVDQLRDGAEVTLRDALFAVDWLPVVPGPASPADQWALLGADRFGAGEALGVGRAFDHVVQIAAAEVRPRAVVTCADGSGEGAEVATAARRLTAATLELVQRWLAEDQLESVPLVVLTRGAVSAVAGEGVRDLAAAAAWGLLRSAQSENPGRLILVDIDADLSGLTSVLDSGEPELALRNGTAYGRRLVRPSGELALPQGLWRLAPDEGGSLNDVAAVDAPEAGQPLGVGQVRVAVRAAGLNFRDVLIGLGMYPGGGVLGSEIAGVVLETGPGVTGFAAGDRVMGIAAGAFGPVAVTDHRQLAAIPAQWSFATAASVPSAFLTAWYALVVLAEARPGQRVLIHAAAGGVGSAAVQIARHLGLEVFATASPAKWPVLRAAGLDEQHIASSRDAGFETTFAAGVDIVVNSLAGELTDASLRLLSGGGTFIEMGKTDRRDPAGFPGVTYRPFDLAEAGPQQLGEMLGRIADLLVAGELTVLPVRAWDVRRAREAFRFMSQARHTGKLVLTIPATGPAEARTVLVTGGTGTLGALVARHLAETGRADSLVLTSRSGPAAAGTAALSAELAGRGLPVRVVACDAAERPALAAVLADVPALSGVVHTAGVLDDGVIGSLTAERIDRVMRPKADGAWNLHELTRRFELDEFVLFSSASSTMGSPGQGNYVAANAFLDALAVERRASGLPATSLAWGMWAQLSALTGQLSDEERARIKRGGVDALTAEQGLALLDAAAARDEALLVPARFDLPKLRAQAAQAVDAGQVPSLWRALIQPGAARRTATSTVSGVDGLRDQLVVLSAADRLRVLSDLVRTQVAAVLGHATAATIEAHRTFTDLGFDSLTAVELRNRLTTATGLRLPATLVFDYPSPTELAEFLRDKLLPELDAGTDSAETELRKALATLPMSRLREAGLMDALLQLAGIRGEVPATTGTEEVEAIDGLDADELIRLALDSEMN